MKFQKIDHQNSNHKSLIKVQKVLVNKAYGLTRIMRLLQLTGCWILLLFLILNEELLYTHYGACLFCSNDESIVVFFLGGGGGGQMKVLHCKESGTSSHRSDKSIVVKEVSAFQYRMCRSDSYLGEAIPYIYGRHTHGRHP